MFAALTMKAPSISPLSLECVSGAADKKGRTFFSKGAKSATSLRGTKFSIKAPTTGKPEKVEERKVYREDELFMGKAAQARKMAAAAGGAGRKKAGDVTIFETALHNKGQFINGTTSPGQHLPILLAPALSIRIETPQKERGVQQI